MCTHCRFSSTNRLSSQTRLTILADTDNHLTDNDVIMHVAAQTVSTVVLHSLQHDTNTAEHAPRSNRAYIFAFVCLPSSTL